MSGIHIVCGLVGAGKTTLARTLADDLPAVRLSRDEWMIRLYGLPYDHPGYAARLHACTELLWDVALDIVRAGSPVVLDWNFWSRKRRADARTRADRAGVPLTLHWLDVPVDVAVSRARTRLAAAPPDAHRIDEAGVRHSAAIFEPPDAAEGISIERHC